MASNDGCARQEDTLRRCPAGNYATRVQSLKPEVVFKPSFHVFDGRTSYKTFFEPKALEKVNSYKPRSSVLKVVGDLEGPSIYKREYVAHEVIPYKKPDWAKAEEFHPPHGVMLGVSSTSYNSAYTGSPGAPARSTKGFVPFDPTRGPLDDKTTYKIDYVPYCNVEKHRGFGPNLDDNMRLCHCVPFRGETTYKGDFTPKSGGARRSFKRSTIPNRTDKMCGLTTYGVSYEPFYYTKDCEPCIPHEVYDQLYPKHPCQCVNCCPPLSRYDGPPSVPDPPCPRPCPPPNPCQPPPQVCQPPYKLTIKNEESNFDPTLITIEPTPSHPCTTCLNF